ncbi:histidinol dehydrogenase [Marivirga sp. S37H4]|uniref:Histidinol dehydrogenase n=1 Tax=Marivirga aurantiaca TaxID=2802615 RepID=A0A934WVS0_9BACT|nr:histidinol dehydrogenase [Marivirga aurantiaca]MBK6263867.1 histidinol dehydrogenase [Marivirga aurantiaca]
MKEYYNPNRESWKELLERPTISLKEIRTVVQPIIDAIIEKGDEALTAYTRKFDGVELENMLVTEAEIKGAAKHLTTELKEAIKVAHKNIAKFHKAQQIKPLKVETMEGVICERKSVAIPKVGLYIPGGSAPLFSTVLMLAIPAKIAGCREIVLCSPPNKEGNLHPAILYAAQLSGITKIIKAGGAQAIAAMAYGTETIPKVDKIFGPGNQYVTAAKQLVSLDAVAIDMPAGPSEVLVYADEDANPAFIAADLLSQAEHGVDSQVVFVTINDEILSDLQKEIYNQLRELPRWEIADRCLQNSLVIILKTEEEAIDLINAYAPEHLIFLCKNAREMADKIENAGSIFLGYFTPESAGDYASGTNHTLPTNGAARAYSGVSLDSFVKNITYQEITETGLKNLGPHVEEMAAAESLQAHKNAVTVRLNSLKNK